jgi:hypothetical protein
MVPITAVQYTQSIWPDLQYSLLGICYRLFLCATYRKSMQVEQLITGGKTDPQKSQQNIR